MPFYDYSQNNSGGNFVGSWHYIIVEALSASSADTEAQSWGAYFDGCAYGRDCSCCGDRWHQAYGSGTPTPMYYGVELNDTEDNLILANPDMGSFAFHPVDILVVFADGSRKEWHFTLEHWAKAKKLKLAATEFLYGFRVYTGRPYSVSGIWKCYKTDYGSADWFAANGNDSIRGLGWIIETKYALGITFGSTTKRQAQEKQILVKAALKTINTEVEKAALTTITNLENRTGKDIADILLKLYT